MLEELFTVPNHAKTSLSTTSFTQTAVRKLFVNKQRPPKCSERIHNSSVEIWIIAIIVS